MRTIGEVVKNIKKDGWKMGYYYDNTRHRFRSIYRMEVLANLDDFSRRHVLEVEHQRKQ